MIPLYTHQVGAKNMTPLKNTSVAGSAGVRRAQRGSTLLEVAIATIVIAIVSLAGTSYYLYARLFEIQAQQEQAAFNVVELEIESWQAEGYGSVSGFTTTTVPYGYNWSWAVADPRRIAYPRLEVREGTTYQITATSIANRQGGAGDGYTAATDFRWREVLGGLAWEYRRIQLTVQWGPAFSYSLVVETRIAQ